MPSEEVVQALGYLPLAIELAAARAAHLHTDIEALAAELRAADRLGKLHDPLNPTHSVHYAFSRSIETLTPLQRARFAALGILDLPDLPRPEAEGLMGTVAEGSATDPSPSEDLEVFIALSLVSIVVPRVTRGPGATMDAATAVGNVADLVDKPKDTNPGEMKTYTPEQVLQLCEAAKGDRLEALYVLLPTTGCRLGELLGLRWEALDLDKGEMRIVAAMKDVGGHQWLGTPKTPRSRRTVPLTSVAIAALKRQHVNQTVERLKHGAAWNPQHLVFCTSHGTAFSQTNFRREYYIPFLEKAGLPYLKTHNAGRHTYASVQLGSGEQVHVVSAWLGHANASTTLNVYAHLMPGAKEEARDRLERTLAANAGK